MNAFKCPNCAGDVRYDIRKAVMCCEHCGSEIRREVYQAWLDAHSLYAADELICPQCGAALLRSDDTLATFCCYCGSSVSFSHQNRVSVKPDGIIPFSITAEEALRCYRAKLKNAFFAPDRMTEDGEKRLIGIYMPYYAFTADAEEEISTVGTRTSLSQANAEEEYRLRFSLQARYSGIHFDAAKAFPDFLSESVDSFCDDGSKGLKPFESSYLAGYYADSGNTDQALYGKLVTQLVSEDLRNGDWECEGFRLQSHAQQPKIRTETKKNLYPVWLITHRWGDRVSYAAVNGQNGKTAVEIPTDKKKYLCVSLIFAALLSLILNFLWTFPPLPFLILSGVLLLLMSLRLIVQYRALYVRQQRLDDIGWLGAAPDSSKAELKQRNLAELIKKLSTLMLSLLLIGLPCLAILSIVFSGSRSLFWSLSKYWYLIPIACFVVGIQISSLKRIRGSWRNRQSWRYWVPWKAVLKACWRCIPGLAMVLIVIFSGSVDDNLYYCAALLNLGLAVWSVFELFEAQNLLMTRDIPVFTEKRGGAEDA